MFFMNVTQVFGAVLPYLQVCCTSATHLNAAATNLLASYYQIKLKLRLQKTSWSRKFRCRRKIPRTLWRCYSIFYAGSKENQEDVSAQTVGTLITQSDTRSREIRKIFFKTFLGSAFSRNDQYLKTPQETFLSQKWKIFSSYTLRRRTFLLRIFLISRNLSSKRKACVLHARLHISTYVTGE